MKDIDITNLRSRSWQLAGLGHQVETSPYIRHPHGIIMVVYDPSDTYERGALFSRCDFAYTLAMGYWPEGMQVRLSDVLTDVVFVVHGDLLCEPRVKLRGVIRRSNATLERVDDRKADSSE